MTEINVFAFHSFIPSNSVVTLMHNVNIEIRKLLVPGMVSVLDVTKRANAFVECRKGDIFVINKCDSV